ncbi:uncharacterized protein LOC143880672 [Tasmannia lanceolata]|uniref:uncharacterized protein LOC143880672 n=1 Tax=Tasmannia lanceolata TaxID=3420 RepID=UPI0040635EEB
MAHRHALEAVDHTFKDLLKHTSMEASHKIFGGKTFALGGDFRQVLPVIPKAGRKTVFSACLQRSYLWRHCKVFHLTTNMRILRQGLSSTLRNEYSFAPWILDVGNVTLPGISIHGHGESDWVKIPDDMLIHENGAGVTRLITDIYPNFITQLHDDSYLEERGNSTTYLSADTVVDGKAQSCLDGFLATPEYLQSLNFPGASTQCYMALNPQVKGVTGTYFCDNNIAMPETQATDTELAKKLWDFSMICRRMPLFACKGPSGFSANSTAEEVTKGIVTGFLLVLLWMDVFLDVEKLEMFVFSVITTTVTSGMEF